VPRTPTLEGHHAFAVLETRLAELIRDLKKDDPDGALAPAAIIAPTRRLLAHLQIRLGEEFPGLLNVHFYHHDWLARAVLTSSSSSVPRALPDGVKETILGRHVQEAGGRLASYLETRPGAVTALAATFEDLREAGVAADAAQGIAGLSPRGRDLARLYSTYGKALDLLAARGLADRAGMLRAALPGLESFIRRFRLVIHYGAYELIGLNLDMMKTIAASGVRLVFLTPFHATAPAYGYARNFWPEMVGARPEVIDRPATAGPLLADRLPLLYDETAAPPALPVPGVAFFHAQGAGAELREVALRILALHRDEDVPLRRIAVISRTLEPYAPLLQPIFSEHGLPFTTTASLSALREARVQAALDLVRSVLGDFERQPLIDLFRSGLFHRQGDDLSREAHAWDRLSREWRVARGYETWTRDLPSWVEEWEPYVQPDADDATRQGAAALKESRLGQARALSQAVSALRSAARPVERAKTWTAWAAAMESIYAETLDGFAPGGADGLDPGAAIVLDVLSEMRVLEAAGLPFTADRALSYLETTLASASLPIGSSGLPGVPRDEDNGGVRILDAMQARGLTFDAVYLIGFNADLFPRRPREDPFLGDEDRLLIRRRLSAPLSIKSAARDEEHLLLAHLLGSARRHLTVSWQRADESGRAKVPSLALREVARVTLGSTDLQRVEEAARRVPAHPGEAGRYAAEEHRVLPASEAALNVALELRSPAALLLGLPALSSTLAEGGTETLRAGLRMLSVVEEFSGNDLRYDAFVGKDGASPRAAWSPSRLESLGACAQHYFFRHVLHVDEMEEPTEAYELDTKELGLLVHRILHDVYEALAAADLLPGPGGGGTPACEQAVSLAAEAWQRHTRRLAARLRPRYPLLWETTSGLWLDALQEFLRRDVAALVASGSRLAGLEERVASSLALDLPGRTIAIEGRFDRLYREGKEDLVVSDYKTSGNLENQTNMATLLKGSRLQMPLYLLMAETQRGTWSAAGARVRAEVIGVGPQFRSEASGTTEDETRATLDPEKFEKNRAGLLETVRVLVDLAAGGSFPLNETSRVCDYCPFIRACRRTHIPTLARIGAAAAAVPYALLRRKSTRAPLLADILAKSAGEDES
jgi:ATP-dependent helicase/nuclease subunit B